MKKYIILSFVLCLSLTFVSVQAQDTTSETKGSEEKYGPRKGDFTAEILLGKGTYFYKVV